MTIQQRIDESAARAQAEIRLLAAFARRSLGQKVRYVQEELNQTRKK